MKSEIKVGAHLALGFSWVVRLLILVTGFGIYNMHQAQVIFTDILMNKNPESTLIKEMLDSVAERSIFLLNLIIRCMSYRCALQGFAQSLCQLALPTLPVLNYRF